MLGGVASGIAKYLSVDPVVVRLVFVALVFAGVSVIAYIVMWIVVPEEPLSTQPADPTAEPTMQPAEHTGRESSGSQTARLIVGVVLVAIGSAMIVDWLVPDFDRFFWPLAVIATGVGMFVYGSRR